MRKRFVQDQEELNHQIIYPDEETAIAEEKRRLAERNKKKVEGK